jgi:cytochrome P450
MEGDLMGEFGLPAMAQSVDGSRKMFTLFRYDDIVAALRNHEVLSSKVIEEVFLPVLGRTVLGMDGEEHRQWRGLYMPAFTRRLVTKWTEEIVRPVARRYTEEFIEAADGKRANLVDFGLRYPVRMIYEILGFPNDDEATYEEFARSGLTILLALGGVNPNDPEQTMRLIQRAAAESQSLYGAIHEIIATRRAEGAEGDDLIGHMLRSEFEGRQLTDDELTVFFRSLVPPASETTTRTWLNVMVCLLTRPDVLDEVRENRELVPAAIDEGVRLEPATTVLGRGTTRDVEVRGVTIPAGSGVTLVAASATATRTRSRTRTSTTSGGQGRRRSRSVSGRTCAQG